MEDVLLSHRIDRPPDDPYERRVRADGTFEERTSVKVEPGEGAPTFTRQPLEWRTMWRLRPRDVEALRKAIERSGFFDTESEYRPPGTAIGGSDVTWTATLDGRTHSVLLHAAPAVRVPQVEALASELEQILAAAGDAAREDAG